MAANFWLSDPLET